MIEYPVWIIVSVLVVTMISFGKLLIDIERDVYLSFSVTVCFVLGLFTMLFILVTRM